MKTQIYLVLNNWNTVMHFLLTFVFTKLQYIGDFYSFVNISHYLSVVIYGDLKLLSLCHKMYKFK